MIPPNSEWAGRFIPNSQELFLKEWGVGLVWISPSTFLHVGQLARSLPSQAYNTHRWQASNWKLAGAHQTSKFQGCSKGIDSICHSNWTGRIFPLSLPWACSWFFLLTTPKPLTVWIKTNHGKFLKRWDYQITLPASWEIYMQLKKQQLETDMEQLTGSILGKEYVKAVYCHPPYLTYMQSTSFTIPGSM